MPTVPKYEIGQVSARGINARQNISVTINTKIERVERKVLKAVRNLDY